VTKTRYLSDINRDEKYGRKQVLFRQVNLYRNSAGNNEEEGNRMSSEGDIIWFIMMMICHVIIMVRNLQVSSGRGERQGTV